MLHFQDEAPVQQDEAPVQQDEAPAQQDEAPGQQDEAPAAPAQGAAPQHPLRVSLSDEEGDIINDTAGVEAAAAAKKKRGRPPKNKK